MPQPTTGMDDRIPFACFVEEITGGLEVSLHGELDLAAVEEFDRTAAEISAEGAPSIVVDLGGLSSLDSTGLLALLRLERDAKARRQTITFVRPSPAIRRAFELRGAERGRRASP